MRTDRYREQPKRKKKSTLKALALLILLLIIAIAGSVYRLYRNAEASIDLGFTVKSLKVGFGEKHTAMSYVKTSEGEVSPSSDMLDTETTGEKKIVYTVTQPVLGGLLAPSKEYTLDYTVTDDAPPVILWSGADTTVQRGSKFDINEHIAYGDNADPSPKVSVKGKVNTDRTGTYPLHVTVTDASGNSNDWGFDVKVTDDIPMGSSSGYDRTKFSDFVSAHKGKGRTFGIDVSAWQDDIDFKKVKKAGCRFVMIRIGYSSDGKIVEDKKFEQNYRRAKEAGLDIGVYFYSTDNSAEAVRRSADWTAEKLGGDKLELPVAFDWEDFGHFQNYEMSFYDLNDLYDEFADELSKSSYDCMLYGSLNYLQNIWKETDKRPVWLAHYTDKTDYKGPYKMWQASCTGSISGINGDVDMNILYE